MNDHVKTLERWINGCREGEEYRVAEAGRALLEEIERLRAEVHRHRHAQPRQNLIERADTAEACIKKALGHGQEARSCMDEMLDEVPISRELRPHVKAIKESLEATVKILQGEKPTERSQGE